MKNAIAIAARRVFIQCFLFFPLQSSIDADNEQHHGNLHNQKLEIQPKRLVTLVLQIQKHPFVEVNLVPLSDIEGCEKADRYNKHFPKDAHPLKNFDISPKYLFL
jgi:hypothetical protein